MRRWCREILTVILVWFVCQYGYAKSHTGITDTLLTVSSKQLSAAAWNIYKEKFTTIDSATAYLELDNMVRIAKERGAQDLEATAYFLKGKFCFEKRLKDQGAVKYFDKTLAISDAPRFLQAEALFYIGFWRYFRDKNYPEGFEYMLKGTSVAEKIGYDKFPNADELLNHLSNAYYQFGEAPKTVKYLKIALSLPAFKQKGRIDMLNTLGLCYRDSSKYDSAKYYFHLALNYATKYKDTAWAGIITGNLGHIYYKSGQPTTALSYLYNDYNISSHNGQKTSAANAALLISQIYFEQGKIDSAGIMLDEGKRLVYRSNDIRASALLYKNLVNYYKYKKDLAKALAYTDSLIFYKDKIAKEKDLADLQKGRNRAETEAHLADLRLLEIEKDKQVLIRNGVVALAFFLIVMGWQAVRKMKLKQVKDLRIYELEKHKAEHELDTARQHLEAYMESLKQKNALLEKFEEEMEALHNAVGNPLNIEKEEILQRLQEATILTEEDWLSFKKLFTKVHPSFFIQLHEKFPTLTQAETRILALSKLGLSVKEKANMLGISPDSVRRTQQRLNKKLGLTENEIFSELVA